MRYRLQRMTVRYNGMITVPRMVPIQRAIVTGTFGDRRQRYNLKLKQVIQTARREG